jgi:hypothetical protein
MLDSVHGDIIKYHILPYLDAKSVLRLDATSSGQRQLNAKYKERMRGVFFALPSQPRLRVFQTEYRRLNATLSLWRWSQPSRVPTAMRRWLAAMQGFVGSTQFSKEAEEKGVHVTKLEDRDMRAVKRLQGRQMRRRCRSSTANHLRDSLRLRFLRIFDFAIEFSLPCPVGTWPALYHQHKSLFIQ